MCLALCAATALVACDDDDSGNTNTSANAGTTGTNSGTTSTNSGTSSTNSGTSSTNNSTTDGSCTEGERTCTDANTLSECTGGELVVVETCREGQVCSTDLCVNEDACDPGEVDGCWPGGTAQRVCNAAGSAFEARECPDGLNCFSGECTDRICEPQGQYCADVDTVHTCNADGTGYENPTPCPDGSVCTNGTCLSGCEQSKGAPSYIGCQYWSVDLDNYNDPVGDPASVPHVVAVSNPSSREATINIVTQAAGVVLDPSSFTVPPGGVETYTFPRLDVDGTGITNHSFFLESNWPVVAYQFNPLNNEGVFSNDASLLLPAESLGTEYIGMSWPTSPIGAVIPNVASQHGYITIVATSEGETDVTVTVSANVSTGSNVPAMTEGQTQSFTLRRYDVLNLQADGTQLFPINDLTGTIITATQPIAVFGGHEEAVVGEGCCAEHLEQQLFPVSTWGLRYLAVQSEPRGGPSDEGTSDDVWRVVAASDQTVITTVPPQTGANNVTLNRGEWLEIETGQSFEIIGDKPIMVGQYLKSAGDTARVTGDPALILAVPIDQFRDSYTVLTPTGYTTNWLTIVRLADAPITLDGQVLDDTVFFPFGSNVYEYAWIRVEEGPHTAESETPFTLSAYGYSNAVSYGYPGGLNLRVPEDQ